MVVLRSLATIGIIKSRKRKYANSNVLASNTFDMSMNRVAESAANRPQPRAQGRLDVVDRNTIVHSYSLRTVGVFPQLPAVAVARLPD